MEEKLREVLEINESMVSNFKIRCDNLLARMFFCETHNFIEEKRITRIQYDSMNEVLERYEDFHTKIQQLLDAWES